MLRRRLPLCWLAAAAALIVVLGPAAPVTAYDAAAPAIVPVKMGIKSLNKADQATLWRRVDEYASVDALLDFCGKKLNLQRRTWRAVAPCVEVKSLRRVASVFRSKKSTYVKAWEAAYGDADKKKVLCDSYKSKFPEYIRILDAHIKEATQMCDACLWC
jgi:hypothetical protein